MKAPPKQTRWLWPLLVLTTFVAYFPALHGAILWDDNMHVTRPDLQDLHGLWRIWFDLGATQQYYPLLHSAFWLEHHLWGDSVLGYHIVNTSLHALAACLLVVLLRRLAVPGAWLAGFLFAVHPVCVEAVAWISEQKSTLSGVFYLSAAIAYLTFDRTRARRLYFVGLGFFILALLSKSVTATLPAALLVVFWWQRGRLDWRRDALPLLPWFAIGAASGLFTAWVESAPHLIGAQGTQYALTWGQRFLLAGRVPWFYAFKDLIPVNLMFIYPHWTINTTQPYQYVFPIALLAAAAYLIWLAHSWRGPLAAFLFFLGTLFPALGFLNVYPFRYSYVADHFQYLAMIGIIVPVACGLVLAISRFRLPPASAALLVALLIIATTLQAENYRDYETLFRNTLAHNPGSGFLHSNLGVVLMSSGREAEAADHFRAAVALAPNDPDFHVNLGLALAQIPGKVPDAIAEYRRALRISPHLPAAHLNLGLAYTSIPGGIQAAIDEYQETIREYATVLKGEGDLWQAHYNLGLALGQTPGHEADALAEYRKALQLKPDSALAHFQMGNIFHKTGKLVQAVAEYQASVALDSTAPEAHYELAYALAQIPGRLPEALEECRRMLELKPDDVAGQKLMASLVAFRAQSAGQ